jgi:hypothetical protein
MANVYLTEHIVIRPWSEPPLSSSNSLGVLITLPESVPQEAKVVKLRMVAAVNQPGAYVSFSPGNGSLESRFRLTAMPQVVSPDLLWPRAYVLGDVPLTAPRQLFMQWDSAGGSIRFEVDIAGWEI